MNRLQGEAVGHDKVLALLEELEVLASAQVRAAVPAAVLVEHHVVVTSQQLISVAILGAED